MTVNGIIVVCMFFVVGNVKGFQTFNDLRARYSPNPTEGYYELPWNTSSPLISNYVEVPANLGLPLKLFCYPNDPRVCLMFDFRGNIAGIQISFRFHSTRFYRSTANAMKAIGEYPYVIRVPRTQAFLSKHVDSIQLYSENCGKTSSKYLYQDVKAFQSYYNYGTVGSFVKTNIMNTPAYSMRAYFTNPTTLTTEGRQYLSQSIEGLWVVLNGTLYSIQLEEPQPPFQSNIGPFYRQNCYPGMGQHYFFQMNEFVPCNMMTPFYPVYARGVLAGFGIADFGRGSVAPGGRVWYENPPRAAVDEIISNRPPCLDRYVDALGIYSLHVYFIDHPWQISCPA